MGGMQVLEWGVTYPERVRSLAPDRRRARRPPRSRSRWRRSAAGPSASTRWRGGDYYDAAPGDGPHEGLAIARMVAQITFRVRRRVHRPLRARDGRRPATGFSLWQRFEVERYLDYHGDKLVRRFDANSYLVIGKAMDLHDVGRGRGGLECRDGAHPGARAARSASARDMLYPTYQQQQIRDAARTPRARRAEYVEIDSPHGHDAFLIDLDQVGDAVDDFLDDMQKEHDDQ